MVSATIYIFEKSNSFSVDLLPTFFGLLNILDEKKRSMTDKKEGTQVALCMKNTVIKRYLYLFV